MKNNVFVAFSWFAILPACFPGGKSPKQYDPYVSVDESRSLIHCSKLDESYVLLCGYVSVFAAPLTGDDRHCGISYYTLTKKDFKKKDIFLINASGFDTQECNGYIFVEKEYYKGSATRSYSGPRSTNINPESILTYDGDDYLYVESCKRMLEPEFKRINKFLEENSSCSSY